MLKVRASRILKNAAYRRAIDHRLLIGQQPVRIKYRNICKYQIRKNSNMCYGEFRPYKASNRYLTLSKVDRVFDRATWLGL